MKYLSWSPACRQAWLVIAALVITAFGGGCGSTSSDTTTTTTTATTTSTGATTTTTTTSTTTSTNPIIVAAGTAVGQSTAVAGLLVDGLADTSSSIGNICGISGGTRPMSVAVIKALTVPVAPPDSFFTTREAGWDGSLVVPSLHTGETVTLTFCNNVGTLIDWGLFTTPTQKKIALFSTINWDELITPEAISTSEWASNMMSWYMSHSYQNIDSMWDYIIWSSVAPLVYSYAEAMPGVPTLAVFETPTPTYEVDMLGSFQGTVTREASAANYGVDLVIYGSMEYDTSIDPAHEVPKTLTGEGTVTLPDGTIVSLAILDFSFVTNEAGGTIPTHGSMFWSFTGYDYTWSGTAYLNGESRTATGEVLRDGVNVGTLYLNALGGAVVTIEGETVNVTAPE